MKYNAWSHRRNYYYKIIKDKVLVIEIRKNKFLLDVFNRKKLERINSRRVFNSLSEAFFKASELEIGYVEK